MQSRQRLDVEFVTTLDRQVISQEGLNVQTVREMDALAAGTPAGSRAMHVEVEGRSSYALWQANLYTHIMRNSPVQKAGAGSITGDLLGLFSLVSGKDAVTATTFVIEEYK